MEKVGSGVKAIVRKDDRILILVKPDGALDLPGGRVEKGETIISALRREIDEEGDDEQEDPDGEQGLVVIRSVRRLAQLGRYRGRQRTH